MQKSTQPATRATKKSAKIEFNKTCTTIQLTITQFFPDRNNNNSEVNESEKNIVLTDRQEAIKDLEKLLKSKKNNLNQQNLRRHWAVLALLYSTDKRKAYETRIEMAEYPARNYNKGVYFAKKIVTQEN